MTNDEIPNDEGIATLVFAFLAAVDRGEYQMKFSGFLPEAAGRFALIEDDISVAEYPILQ